MPPRLARAIVPSILVSVFLFVGVRSASAQIGTLTGRVVDEGGKPVADATVTFDYAGEQNLHFTVKTNDKGEWVRAGLRAIGRWTITAQKGDLLGKVSNVVVPLGTADRLKDIVLKAGAPDPAAASNAANAANAALAKLAAEGDAAMTAGNYDLAISKFTEAAGKTKACGGCYVRIGDAQMKKQDLASAEQSYLKAIEVDATSKDAADAYGALAGLYNQQKKFDEATKMAERAKAMAPATGGDAASVFNAGAILFNQGKIAEAKAQFARAIELNPRMAEAHYSLAMCLVNEGKIAEAKTSLKQYLTLAPNGPNAATAKAILDTP